MGVVITDGLKLSPEPRFEYDEGKPVYRLEILFQQHPHAWLGREGASQHLLDRQPTGSLGPRVLAAVLRTPVRQGRRGEVVKVLTAQLEYLWGTMSKRCAMAGRELDSHLSG